MKDVELDRQIDALSKKSQSLFRGGNLCHGSDLRRLYELTGIAMQQSYGTKIDYNPCSVASISSVVLKMAKEIAPCRLLNVGVGGYPFVDIELIKNGFSVVGVEISRSLTRLALDVSKYQGHKLQLLVADGMQLPFRDASFEACLCSETIEHVLSDVAVIRETHRVLKPGGTLLLTVPCVVALHGLLQRVANYPREGTLVSHQAHLREYTYFSAKRLVNKYFTVQRWYSVPFTSEPFRKMPYEKLLSLFVSVPILKSFSLSIAFILRRREEAL